MIHSEERTKGLDAIQDMEDGVYEFYQIYLNQIQEEQAGKKDEGGGAVDHEKEQQVFSGVFPNHSLFNESSTSESSSESEEPKEVESRSEKDTSLTIHFYFVLVVIPCLISVWYSLAMFFPPQTREKYSLVLWDDGELLFDDQGRPTICPRPSICSEGIRQIILVSISRVTAFSSYVFMGVTFLSKMRFTVQYLPSSLKTRIQCFGDKGWNIFVGLAVLHAVAHYIRYIARQDTDQLATMVHISGLVSLLAVSVAVVNDCCKKKIGEFKRSIIHNWLLTMMCIALCYHHKRAMVISLIFFGLWALDSLLRVVVASRSVSVKDLNDIDVKTTDCSVSW